MKKKIVIVILCATFLMLAGAVVARYVLEQIFDFRLFGSAAICLVTISQVIFGRERKRSGEYQKEYEKEYGHILKKAFFDRRPLRKKLLGAIDLYNRNQLRSAISKLKALRKKCQTADDHAAVLMFTALCYTDMGTPENAIAAYRELFRYDAHNSTAWSNLGILYEKKGQREEAITCYENALASDGENPYAYNNLANSHYRMGNYELAIENAEKALTLKHNLYQASNVLSLSYQALNMPERSQEYYRISVANGADATSLRVALSAIETN